MTPEEKKLILSKLRGMETADLASIVSALERLSQQNLLPQDIFPEGIIVKDSARARFILSPAKHKELMDIINENLASPIFRDLTIFPLGIIKSDLYETKIQLGGKEF